jgi:hypothetical protein
MRKFLIEQNIPLFSRGRAFSAPYPASGMGREIKLIVEKGKEDNRK